jgi:hypothetical protein
VLLYISYNTTSRSVKKAILRIILESTEYPQSQFLLIPTLQYATMESAKEAISKFTSRHGHTTEVDETVSRPVTSETVKPTRHENITQAVDRETHQHHHHTTVQPLSHQEMLPEKHSHNQLPVEKREFHHGNDSETRERLQTEAAKFKDTSRTHETHHTEAALPTAQGEHVHHHVHET